MLNPANLKQKIKDCFDQTIPDAFEQALLGLFPGSSEIGNDKAKEFGKTFCDIVSEPWAEQLSSAIDYYIKSGCVYGMILTTGSPVAQQAVIPPGMNLGNPAAGAVPNTLGIM